MSQQPGSQPAKADVPRPGDQSASSTPAPTPRALPPAPRRARSRLSFFSPRAGSSVDPLLAPLLETMTAVSPKENLEIVRRAYTVAERAHRGQTRKSGDPYITHPVSVATILAEMGYPADVVAAALLHDTVEDTDYSLERLRQRLRRGDRRAWSTGSPNWTRSNYGEAAQAETVRKMIVAMSRDIRVLLIKLADRLHNARTWKYVPAASS